MPDLFATALDDEIGEVERELRARTRVYRRLIDTRQLTQSEADRRMQLMQAVLTRLKKLKTEGGG